MPNVAHWYPRFRSTLGMFDYDQRGILDSTHVRFFTRRSLVKLVERRGFAIRRVEPVGLPLDAFGVDGTPARSLRLVDRLLSNLWPTMFGYQFIVEATPVRILKLSAIRRGRRTASRLRSFGQSVTAPLASGSVRPCASTASSV